MEEKLEELYKEYLNQMLDATIETKEKKLNNQETNIEKKYKKVSVFCGLDNTPIERLINMYTSRYIEPHEIYKYNLEKPNGELISDKWFDDVGSFHEGFAIVKKSDKYNYIDTTGNLIGDVWFDGAFDFKGGLAIVVKNDKKDIIKSNPGPYKMLAALCQEDDYNIINTEGNLISDKWFSNAYILNNGLALVKIDDKYYYIDNTGTLISNKWFDDVGEFHEDFVIVKKNGQYNFINTEDELISKDLWFDEVENFKDGYAKVRRNKKWNYIDVEGHILLDKWSNSVLENLPEIEHVYKNFVTFKTKPFVVCRKKSYGQLGIEKKLTKYVGIYRDLRIDIKYEPVKVYGFTTILCLNKEEVYLLDDDDNTYKCLGTVKDVSYDDNFIYTKNKVYFVYNDKLHDITDYYNEKIQDKEITNIKRCYKILSKKEFSEKYKYKIQEEVSRLKKLQKESQERQRKQEILRKEGISQVTEGLKKIHHKEEIDKVTITEENLFITINDHKEINPLYLNTSFYKYIDLSLISFENVKISGIDFRDCNIHLNPQKVYNKDLTNCNFEGINIPPFMDFTDVDIRGAKFSQDEDWKTQDGYNQTFINAIYDETTTYNGIPFTDIYGPCKKEKRNIR